MRALILIALVSIASAKVGPLKLSCEDGWHMYQGERHQASCLRTMDTELRFPDAFKACFDQKSHMLSFSHKWRKIEFVNRLIISDKSERKNTSLWFFDPYGINSNLLHGKGMPPKPEDWMVIEPSEQESQIKLSVNSADVPRNFICEKPARAEAQRAQFALQPEDAQMSADVMEEERLFLEKPKTEELKAPKPFIITFNCHAFALPKPLIKWMLITDNKTSLETEEINAEMILDPREPLKHLTVEKPTFFDLRRDCQKLPCNDAAIQERSQLILVGAQLFDVKKRVACVATNEFGSVVSREARITINSMEQFPKEEPIINVREGMNITVPCELETNPDAASVEWVRIEQERAIPLELINEQTRGGLQMSKSTFDLIIDYITLPLEGRYACRVSMHNGRVGRVTRQRIVHLRVEPCEGKCDLTTKAVSVVEGYPTVLSMNPASNELIRSGDDFMLECPCFGKRNLMETLRVEWQMVNEVKGEIVPILPRGAAVMMSNADEEFSGKYQCRCMREEESSEWKTVKVEVLPKLVPKEVDLVQAKVGSEASITCQMPEINIKGLNFSVLPMRGNVSLVDVLSKTNDERFSLTAAGQTYKINIKDVKETDADVYACRVRVNFFNKWTDIDSFYTSLIVEK